MSNYEQLRENIATFEEHKPLSASEKELILSVAAEMTSVGTVPCTACRYCIEKCPMGINIPWILELYNEHMYSGGGFIAPNALKALPEDKKPSACLGCGACESVCPQNIKISRVMAELDAKTKK